MIKGYIISTLYPHFGNITVLYIHVYFRGKRGLKTEQTPGAIAFHGFYVFPHPSFKNKKERLN